MKIEILYPEIANLFGDLANIKYMMASVPDCKIIGTDLNTKPAFLTSDDVDLVYMGTMTENAQLIAMDHLEPYKDEIWKAIETMHPEIEVWETCTPYFDRRNIHFYINRCGFHAVEFFNEHHPDPNMPEQFDQEDGLFKFEKKIR